ncbi:hypothetical protein E4U15_002922 [Claviceps sp. LM218 group G6]|nr:hypothetical protein E4U15_002922 [Claviceps sp. LM218 group G6]
MSSTSSCLSPANGLNIPNDLGEVEIRSPLLGSRPHVPPLLRPGQAGPSSATPPEIKSQQPRRTILRGGWEPTTLEKPASRVASQQLLKEPNPLQDVFSGNPTAPEERGNVSRPENRRAAAWHVHDPVT